MEARSTAQASRRLLLLGSAAWLATGWRPLAAAAIPGPSRTASIALTQNCGVAGSAGTSAGLAQGSAVRQVAFEEFAASVAGALRAVSAQAIRDLHAAGVPAATVDAAGRLAWRMPDGTAVPMDDPNRLPPHRPALVREDVGHGPSPRNLAMPLTRNAGRHRIPQTAPECAAGRPAKRG